MRFVETRSLAHLAIGGVAATAGTVAATAGDPRTMAATGGGILLAAILTRPALGLVLMGVVSPLLPAGMSLAFDGTIFYWPAAMAPLLVPGILITLLTRRVHLRALDVMMLAFGCTAIASLVAAGVSTGGVLAVGIVGIIITTTLCAAWGDIRTRFVARFLTFLWVACLAEALLVVVSFVASGSPLARYVGHLGTLQHGFLASFLSVGVAVGTVRISARRIRGRAQAILGLALLGLALVVVSARAGVIAAATSFLVTALLVSRRSLIFPALVLLAGGVALHLSGTDVRPALERAAYVSTNSEIEETLTRWHLLRDSWQLVCHNPWLGIGPGNFASVSSFMDYAGRPINSPHNNYLQVAAEMGIAGLVFLLAILGLALRKAIGLARQAVDRSDRLLGAAAAGVIAGAAVQCLAGDFLVPSISNNGFDGLRSAVVIWVLIGLVASRHWHLHLSSARSNPGRCGRPDPDATTQAKVEA